MYLDTYMNNKDFKRNMEISDILVRCKNWHIGPEALYIGQVRRSDVFRIDC
jgi:hypothetical protein